MSYRWAYVELREAETLGVIEHIRGTSSLDDRETTATMLRRIADRMEDDPDDSPNHAFLCELRIAAAKLDLAEERVKEWAKTAKFQIA